MRSLVRSTLDERVTLYGEGTAGENGYGEATMTDPVEVGTVPAHVLPEASAERVENDRIEGTGTLTVRVDLSDVAKAVATAGLPLDTVPDSGWSLVWERSVARGGPLALGVSGVSDRRGRFIDLLCTSSVPVGAAEGL